jgi:uncharacterized membrane protein YbhN (UPF0104 family)
VLSLLAIVALGILATRYDWRALVQPIETLRIAPFLAAVLLALAVEVVKTLRWQLLLGAPLAALPRLLGVLFTGRLLNALVPLRAGDLWRVTSVSCVEQRPIVAAGGSVVIEKVLDGAALGALVAVMLWQMSLATVLLLILAAVLLLGIALLPIVERQVGRKVLLAHCAAAIAYLRDWRLLGAATALTIAGLALGTLVNLAVLYALDLPVDLQAGLTMLVAGYAAGLIPSGPAQLGVFELAVAVPLSGRGLSYPAALAAAVTLHVVLLVMLALGGIVALALALAGWNRPAASR